MEWGSGAVGDVCEPADQRGRRQVPAVSRAFRRNERRKITMFFGAWIAEPLSEA